MTDTTDKLQDFQYQYVEGQGRPTFPALLDAYQAAGDAAIAAEPCDLDVRYGAAERQTFDFFPAHGTPTATLVYYHAGYWQSRGKSWFRFIGPAYTRLGLNVAFVDYPLCPDVTLAELIEAARAAVPAVLAHARALGQPELPLIAAGHSAGGHLATEMALSIWPALGARAQAVDGVLALSGIYDLLPLVSTTLNQKLRLDAAAAVEASPLLRVRAGLPPALFIVGAEETPAFLAQNRAMAEAWRRAGNDSAVDETAAVDHFSLLQAFCDPGNVTRVKVEGLIDQARRRFAALAKGVTTGATTAIPADSTSRDR